MMALSWTHYRQNLLICDFVQKKRLCCSSNCTGSGCWGLHSNLSVWPETGKMCMRSSQILKGRVTNAAVLLDGLEPVRENRLAFFCLVQ